MIKRQKLIITGRVQGVGFRPYAYRVAAELSLTGFIFNDTRGVTIEIQGPGEKLESFAEKLTSARSAPPLMKIITCKVVEVPVIVGESKFAIRQSDSKGTALSQVTADSATCGDCLRELFSPADYRYRYPFINCTNCGPRYSIIKRIPYDRPNTTMSEFPMCPVCKGQYENIADRRFHAQPVACAICGPKIWLTDNAGQKIQTDSRKAIEQTIELLLEGQILAIKGIGGFLLAVDATNEDAVWRLRERKRREHKPFAMMAGSVTNVRKYAELDEISEEIIKSPQSPIVLLRKTKPSKIAPSVASGTSTLGFMLCYAPLHHLLFNTIVRGRQIDVLVMTSANLSDEPLIHDNDEALAKIGDVADYFLMHDRDIYRQVDDSVVQVIDKNPAFLRRSRGYVPTPILMDQDCQVDVLAAGSDLKNTFCFVKRNQLILSEHIGDLEKPSTYRHYHNSIKHLAGLFELDPKLVVCDLHPGYLSTQYAQSLKDLRLVQVQHHWAHAASVIAEYDCPGPVIALCADGTGYGTDGAIWGCECLVATLDEFDRAGHLKYYPLAGADKASKEPIRPVLGLLKNAFGNQFDPADFHDILHTIEPDILKIETIFNQIEKKINIAQTSSLGRVFDAVAALTGLGNYNYFEAQLPMALEAIADPTVPNSYGFEIYDSPEDFNLDLSSMFKAIIADIRSKTAVSVISAKFQNTLAASLNAMALRARNRTNIDIVALSGGVFCNRYLTERLITLLKQNNFCVLLNRYAPVNDGCIALGQATIGAKYAILKGLK